MTSDKFLLDTERTADPADLILEKHTERLHNLQVHLFRKTTHIMMGLDLRSDTRNAGRLDHIRIDGTLGKPLGIFDSMGIFVKSLDKETSDNLSLGFRL